MGPGVPEHHRVTGDEEDAWHQQQPPATRVAFGHPRVVATVK